MKLIVRESCALIPFSFDAEDRLSTNRRQLLQGIAASALIGAVPTAARAVAYLAVLQAAAAIASIIKSLKSQGNENRTPVEIGQMLGAINGKLDAIIDSQRQIVDEIRNLQIQIRQDIYEQFRENDIRELSAKKNVFDFLVRPAIDGDPSSQDNPFLKNFLQQTMELTFKLGSYDVMAFCAFGAGVCMVLFLEKVSKTPPSVVANLKKNLAKSYDNWLDPSNPGGIVFPIDKLDGVISSRISALNGRTRGHTLSNDRVVKDDQNCRVIRHEEIEGNFGVGFHSSVSANSDDCHGLPRPPPDDSNPGPHGGGRTNMGYLEKGTKFATRLTDPSDPCNEDSWLASFNEERDAILSLQEQVKTMEEIKKHLEEALRDLRGS